MGKKQDYLLKRQGKDYAAFSSIHGLMYISEENRPHFEGILWIILCTSSFILCITLIIPIFNKWQDTPTYTSINTTNYPVWNMPFPGVTICSNILIHRAQFRKAVNASSWQRYRTNSTDLTAIEFERKMYEALKLFTKFSSNEAEYNTNDSIVMDIINKENMALTILVEEVRHKCSDIFLECRWQDKVEKCTPKLFETSRTDTGYCCSFNALKISEQFDETLVDFETVFDEYDDFYENDDGEEDDDGDHELSNEDEEDDNYDPKYDNIDFDEGSGFGSGLGSGSGSGNSYGSGYGGGSGSESGSGEGSGQGSGSEGESEEESGSGSGNEEGSESGSASGAESEEESGSGSGKEEGSGSGSASGAESEEGSGSGSSSEQGSGSGGASGAVSEEGSGSGSSSEEGSGSGSASGAESEEESGSGSGKEEGSGSGSASGAESEEGSGSGSSSEEGSGSGGASGVVSEEGSGSGSSSEQGSGSGGASGAVSEEGSGSGSSSEEGSGSGSASGAESEEESGSGSGNEEGSGSGSASGAESEEGSGSGSGSEQGTGSDSSSGGGNGSGSGSWSSASGSGSGSAKRRRKRSAFSAESALAANLRVLNSASAKNGLSVMVKINSAYYEITEPEEAEYEMPAETEEYSFKYAKNDFYGFRVLVHSPYEFPEVGGKGFAVGAGNVAYIGVAARATSSTEKVKKMTVLRRNCVRFDESDEALKEANVRMEIFSNYSRRSCILECRARELRQNCHCLPYYFPNFGGLWNENTACNLTGLQCLARHSSILTAIQTGFDDGANCFCPLECDDVVYLPELSQVMIRDKSDIVDQKVLLDSELVSMRKRIKKYQTKLAGMAKGATGYSELEWLLRDTQTHYDYSVTNAWKDMAVIHVYYRELGIIQYTRDELYSVTDFIAAAGGLIGLCMGFSLLSAAEIVYWFTVRTVVDYKRKKDKEKKQTEMFRME